MYTHISIRPVVVQVPRFKSQRGSLTIDYQNREALFEPEQTLDRVARGVGTVTVATAIGAATFLLVQSMLNK